MRRFVFSLRVGYTGLTTDVRLFGTTNVSLAPKRAVTLNSKKRTSGSCKKALSLPSSSSSSSALFSSTSCENFGEHVTYSCEAQNDGGSRRKGRGNSVTSQVTRETGYSSASDHSEDEEERRLAEGDTRLAMRLLMQHHFLYQINARRPEELRMEEERKRLQEKHRARMERIEQKTRNSMGLGSDLSVDGVLPLYRREGVLSTAPAPKRMASWRRPNPVEAEDGGGCAAGGGFAGLLLTKPDISAYSAEHDHRIRSAEVVDEENMHRRDELNGGEATRKLLTREELESGGGLTPQCVVRSQMLQDEDQDFAVEAYFGGNDDDE